MTSIQAISQPEATVVTGVWLHVTLVLHRAIAGPLSGWFLARSDYDWLLCTTPWSIP